MTAKIVQLCRGVPIRRPWAGLLIRGRPRVVNPTKAAWMAAIVTEGHYVVRVVSTARYQARHSTKISLTSPGFNRLRSSGSSDTVRSCRRAVRSYSLNVESRERSIPTPIPECSLAGDASQSLTSHLFRPPVRSSTLRCVALRCDALRCVVLRVCVCQDQHVTVTYASTRYVGTRSFPPLFPSSGAGQQMGRPSLAEVREAGTHRVRSTYSIEHRPVAGCTLRDPKQGVLVALREAGITITPGRAKPKGRSRSARGISHSRGSTRVWAWLDGVPASRADIRTMYRYGRSTSLYRGCRPNKLHPY